MTGGKRAIPAEMRILAAALKSWEAPAAFAAQVAALGGALDWDFVLRLAVRHRVGPMLADRVAAAGISLPDAVADRLARTRTSAAFDELALASTTRSILDSFRLSAIEPVILKGIPLSYQLHGRLGLRLSRDIDLLVGEGQVAQAAQLLQAQGFRPSRGTTIEGRRRHEKDVEFTHEETGHLVELHWRLFDNAALMPVSALPAAEWTALPLRLSCHTLPIRYNLLYLANHGAQHGWSRLKWLADFAGLLHSFGRDMWADLYRATSLRDGRRTVGQALLLCRDFFDFDIPPDLAAELMAQTRVKWLCRIARHSILRSSDAEIEHIRFGSTAKNASHYLIRSDADYLLSEIAYDFAKKLSLARHDAGAA